MASFGFAYPVLPGKEGIIREVSNHMRSRGSEFQESRQRAGIMLERAYLQKNPDGGTVVVAYVEANGGFADALKSFQTSGLAIDRYFLEKNSEATGVDFMTPAPAGPEPELVGEWTAPGATSRQRGFAFAAPLQPGATDAARRFAQEAYVARKDEMAESRSSKGLSCEMVFLNQTPAGEIVVVYLEGADPVDANRQFAASNTPFDRWFKDQCKQIFPPFIDFDQPVPSNEEAFSSTEIMATV